MNCLEVTFRVYEDFIRIQTNDGPEFTEGIAAWLEDAPEFCLLEVFGLLSTSDNLIFESDLGVLEDDIDFVAGGTETA